MAIQSVNPATGETIETFSPLTKKELEAALTRAALAFTINRNRSFDERAARMNRASAILEERAATLAALMTLEMGKPITAAIAEVKKCADACRFYARHAESYLRDEPVETSAQESYIRYEPMGVVLAVMPWNFPLWQVFRFAAPALMAGNVGLLKHASNVPQCALAIEAVFDEAGFNEGEFQALLIESKQVPLLIDDARVVAVTLTGSEPAGSAVASRAAKQIKKAVLELGGSDPFIVMPSADLDDAIATAVKARTVNNGQSCIAAKRFIVHESIADEFERGFVKAMESLRVGDPMDEATEVGPLATTQLLSDIDEQVQKSVAMGARLLTGGHRIGEKGNFYAPTVLTDLPDDAPAAKDETFGPVAAIFRVDSIESAIARANATPFGLGSSVWTNDAAEVQAFVGAIEAGQVFVNAMVASDPRVPFGGIKRSGYGRELGAFGIREFVNVKTVWIAKMGASKTNVKRDEPGD